VLTSSFFCRFLDTLGTLFHFVTHDVKSKIHILESYLAENEANYLTINSVLTYEVENKLTKTKVRHPRLAYCDLLLAEPYNTQPDLQSTYEALYLAYNWCGVLRLAMNTIAADTAHLLWSKIRTISLSLNRIPVQTVSLTTIIELMHYVHRLIESWEFIQMNRDESPVVTALCVYWTFNWSFLRWTLTLGQKVLFRVFKMDDSPNCYHGFRWLDDFR